MYAASATHRRWLWLAEFVHEDVEGTVAFKDGKPGLQHIPIDRSRTE
jgi:hypothetical protein